MKKLFLLTLAFALASGKLFAQVDCTKTVEFSMTNQCHMTICVHEIIDCCTNPDIECLDGNTVELPPLSPTGPCISRAPGSYAPRFTLRDPSCVEVQDGCVFKTIITIRNDDTGETVTLNYGENGYMRDCGGRGLTIRFDAHAYADGTDLYNIFPH